MQPQWKWDWQHVVILLAFAAGLAWSVLGYLMPLIQAGTLSPMVILPLAIGVVSSVLAFFKNPPSNPSDALHDGEAGGLANKRGFVQLAELVAISVVGLVVVGALLVGCISVSPTVPVTPDNKAKIDSCGSTGALHNDFVIGGIVTGALATGAGGVAASVPDNKGLQQAMAITAASGALLTGIATGGAGFTAAAFTDNKCTDVVSPLPMKPNPAGAPAVALLPSFSEMQ
jgi:hypothetical protein